MLRRYESRVVCHRGTLEIEDQKLNPENDKEVSYRNEKGREKRETMCENHEEDIHVETDCQTQL